MNDFQELAEEIENLQINEPSSENKKKEFYDLNNNLCITYDELKELEKKIKNPVLLDEYIEKMDSENPTEKIRNTVNLRVLLKHLSNPLNKEQMQKTLNIIIIGLNSMIAHQEIAIEELICLKQMIKYFDKEIITYNIGFQDIMSALLNLLDQDELDKFVHYLAFKVITISLNKIINFEEINPDIIFEHAINYYVQSKFTNKDILIQTGTLIARLLNAHFLPPFELYEKVIESVMDVFQNYSDDSKICLNCSKILFLLTNDLSEEDKKDTIDSHGFYVEDKEKKDVKTVKLLINIDNFNSFCTFIFNNLKENVNNNRPYNIILIKFFGNIILKDDGNALVLKMIDLGILDLYKHVLTLPCSNKTIIKEVCWNISNIACSQGGPAKLINEDFCPILVNYILNDTAKDIKKECIWALCNLTCADNIDLFKKIVEQNILEALANIFQNRNEEKFREEEYACSCEAILNLISDDAAYKDDESDLDSNIMKCHDLGIDKMIQEITEEEKKTSALYKVAAKLMKKFESVHFDED